MTQAIRDAAQALIDIVMQQCGATHLAGPAFEAAEKARALRVALSAPQPTADERVAELVQTARDIADGLDSHRDAGTESFVSQMLARIEASARALLSASQEDAEHAAMYRWLVYQCTSGPLTIARVGTFELIPWSGDNPDAVIRAAMSAKETK